jgi:hypothetical protein
MDRHEQTFEVKLRLPPSWREPIKHWAAAERRSPTQLIRNIVDDALAAHRREDGATA